MIEEIAEAQNMPFFIVDKFDVFNKTLRLKNQGQYGFDLRLMDMNLSDFSVHFTDATQIIPFVEHGADIPCYYQIQGGIEFEITFCIQFTTLTHSIYVQGFYLNYFYPERNKSSIPTRIPD